jgi:hypothetical protein
MTITAENIAYSHQIGQQAADSFAALLIENIAITPSDSKVSIENKIAILTSLKNYILHNIDIDALPNDALQLKFIKLIAQLNEQIEAFNILVGKFSHEDLKRIGQHFARKTQYPVGLTD